MVDQERKTIRVLGSMVLLLALVALSIVLIMSGTGPSLMPLFSGVRGRVILRSSSS
jgi:hypothetical protein